MEHESCSEYLPEKELTPKERTEERRILKRLEAQEDRSEHYKLEQEADKLLALAGGDSEYPYYTEKGLRRKMREHEEGFPSENNSLLATNAFISSGEEIRYLIEYLASNTPLSELEHAMLTLTLAGWRQEEIANELAMSRRTYGYKWGRLREKLSYQVNAGFWASLRSPTIYRHPNKCCVAGKEACKSDSGRCPYGRTGVPGRGATWERVRSE